MVYKNIVRLFKNYLTAMCMSEVWEMPSCVATREPAGV